MKHKLKKPHRKIISLSYDLSMTDTHRTRGPHCPIHPETALICPRCIAARGGQSKSKKKLAAARRNAKLGGRPKNKRR